MLELRAGQDLLSLFIQQRLAGQAGKVEAGAAQAGGRAQSAKILEAPEDQATLMFPPFGVTGKPLPWMGYS